MNFLTSCSITGILPLPTFAPQDEKSQTPVWELSPKPSNMRNFHDTPIQPPTSEPFQNASIATSEIDHESWLKGIRLSKNPYQAMAHQCNALNTRASECYRMARMDPPRNIPYTLKQLRSIYSLLGKIYSLLLKLKQQYPPIRGSENPFHLISTTQSNINLYIIMLKRRIIPGWQSVEDLEHSP